MKKPLDVKTLDVFLSAVEDRLTHLESKMYKEDDEEREPVSEDTIEKKGACPECGLPEGECKCGYFDIDAKSYIVDAETKVRYVRDAAYWGVPVMTPIAPGMKPKGPTSPTGRARRSSMTGRSIRRSMPSTSTGSDKTPGRAAPRKRVKPKRAAGAGDGESGGKKPVRQRGGFSGHVVADEELRRIRAESRRESGGKKPVDKTPGSNGISQMHFGTGGKGPGGSTHRAEIGQDEDGSWRASFTRLNPKSGGESGGRTNVQKFESREEAEAWVNNSAKRSKVSANPDADKESDKEAGEIRDRYNPEGSDSESKFGKDKNDRYTAAKAEDFSVDAVAKELGGISKEGSANGSGSLEDPIDVGDDVELAHKLLAEGKHIRMKDSKSVSSLLDKLHDVVMDARERGDKAPEYDLCKVSVPKTNLFCIESKGVPRVFMPQFKGAPHEGSYAETKLNPDKGEADVEAEFRELLDKMGIKTEMKTVKASDLKASQENLDGGKVAGMARAMKEGKIPDAPIFVTRDGYIVDGHHRWAAKVAMDIEDGVLGDIEMMLPSS